MNGMDVMRRCAAYERDMERMQTMLLFLRDAATRITRPTDAQGRGGGGDKMAELAACADEIERSRQARCQTHNMEIVEALRLVGEMRTPEMGAIFYRKYVGGETYAAIAAGLRTSEDSVRSTHRRGMSLLMNTPTQLARSDEYRRLRALERKPGKIRLDDPFDPA